MDYTSSFRVLGISWSIDQSHFSPFLLFLGDDSKMSKVILSTLVAAFVCVASAKAENSISSTTLSEMGLSGISMMSDNDALAIRGKGFLGGIDNRVCSDCGPRSNVPSLAGVLGQSEATIAMEDCPDCVPTGGAHSENGYLAFGPYFAAGSNYSEAGAVVSKTEIVDIGGVLTSITNICTTKVFAGGNSTARAF